MPSVPSTYDSFRKAEYRSVKWSTYFHVYDRLLSRYRGKNVTFVEIGVLDGGSLFMWRDFLGPQARIIGVEFNPQATRWREHGFEIFIGDQSDPSFWKEFYGQVGPLDVLLDDGGHTFKQQIVTTECAIDHINDGGLIIVEDTHTSYFKDFGGPSRYSFVSYAKNIADGINYRHARFEPRHKHETSIQSVQFFESIVAFEVSKALSGIECEFMDNGGKALNMDDFRYEGSKFLKVDAFADKFSFFSNLPVIGRILRKPYRFLRKWSWRASVARDNFRLRRYFKY